MHPALALLIPPVVAGVGVLAAQEPLPGWVEYIQSGGVIGMFVIFTYLMISRKLVMGWSYDAMAAERDYYRDIALKSVDIADRQVQTAEEMLKRMDTLALRSEVLETREESRRRRGDPLE